MKLLKAAEGVILEVYVKPYSKSFAIKFEGDELIVACSEAPVKGRVNRELVKELSKLFKRKVELISGLHSRHKKIMIRKIETDEVNQFLDSVSATGTYF